MSDPTTNNPTPPTPTTATASATKSALTAGGTLGKDDFLKLLLGRIQHQDPVEPANDPEFIGQRALFWALEQESNAADSASEMAEQLARTGALGLIGNT